MDRLFNAVIKDTGERAKLRKEEKGTLFEDFYSDYYRKEYYREDEFELLDEFKPLVITLTEKETVDYEDFCDEHKHKGVNFGAIGGAHSIILTGTGLGWGIQARCNYCGKTKDITDYECW